MKLLVLFVSLAVAASAVAAVCGPASQPGADGGSGNGVPEGRKVVEAPIDDLELLVRESFPPQYAVRIVSGLPNGCAEFHEAKVVSETDRAFEIRVTNTVPADDRVACTMVYGQHESVVELGSDLRSGQEYVVKVNDRELQFIGQ